MACAGEKVYFHLCCSWHHWCHQQHWDISAVRLIVLWCLLLSRNITPCSQTVEDSGSPVKGISGMKFILIVCVAQYFVLDKRAAAAKSQQQQSFQATK